MALRIFECTTCKSKKETLKKTVPQCHGDMKELMVAPNQKFMVTSNAAEGKSKLKDSDKVLKARARNHSRDVLGDETIQMNLNNGLKETVTRNLLNNKQERRRKIDDI